MIEAEKAAVLERLIETRDSADRFWDSVYQAYIKGMADSSMLVEAMAWANASELALIRHRHHIRRRNRYLEDRAHGQNASD